MTFESTQFLETFSGATLWLVISLEEPVIAGRTVAWNKSPSATGNVALSVNGAAFTSQGANVSMPAFKVIGEGLNGACCNTATSQCILTGHLECTRWNGFVYTPGSSCSVNTCAATGACCTGVACAVTTQAACGSGRFLGVATTCQGGNGTNACCAADFNGVGGLSVQDVFDFLAAWFAGCP